jgi:hypothetical protein
MTHAYHEVYHSTLSVPHLLEALEPGLARLADATAA